MSFAPDGNVAACCMSRDSVLGNIQTERLADIWQGERAQSFREREAQWERFHAWEADHPLTFPSFDMAWRWYEEMWRLARQLNPDLTTPSIDPEKIKRQQELHERLSRLRWPN